MSRQLKSRNSKNVSSPPITSEKRKRQHSANHERENKNWKRSTNHKRQKKKTTELHQSQARKQKSGAWPIISEIGAAPWRITGNDATSTDQSEARYERQQINHVPGNNFHWPSKGRRDDINHLLREGCSRNFHEYNYISNICRSFDQPMNGEQTSRNLFHSESYLKDNGESIYWNTSRTIACRLPNTIISRSLGNSSSRRPFSDYFVIILLVLRDSVRQTGKSSCLPCTAVISPRTDPPDIHI